MTMIEMHPMVAPVLFPILMGILCLLIPSAFKRAHALFAIAATAVTVAMVWPLFAWSRSGMMETVAFGLIPLRLDMLAGLMVLGIGVFGLISAIYSLGYMAGAARLREYYAYLLWTVGLACGAVLASDLVVLLVMWGLLGILLYLMIGIGGPGASAAAKKSLVVVGGSDCLLVLGVAILWVLDGSTRMDLVPVALKGELRYVAFFCFIAAAFAKAGGMPLHSWVPDCGAKAPVSVTAFLPASLDKLLGIYLLVRVTWHMFAMSPLATDILMLAGAGTVVCAVMMALVQHDLKRLLSYHAVSQVGYMILGICSGNPLGLLGGLFHMVNHAMYKSALFFGCGAVEKKAGTTDLDQLGGLGARMPVTFATFAIAAAAISGIPPLNGFASKWMVYQGIIESSSSGNNLWIVWLAAAMLGSAFTLASFVKALHAVFLKKPAPELAAKKTGEVGFFMLLPVVVLAAGCIIFGVFADSIPVKLLISPVVSEVAGLGRTPVTIPGAWIAAPATIMMLVAYAAGILFYLFSSARKVRVCETYIGGERLDDAYVSGDAIGAGRDLEVSGVDFYRTIDTMRPFGWIYREAARGTFDLYEMGRRGVFYFVTALQRLHSGLLPAYMTWFLFGLIAVLWILVYGLRLV